MQPVSLMLTEGKEDHRFEFERFYDFLLFGGVDWTASHWTASHWTARKRRRVSSTICEPQVSSWNFHEDHWVWRSVDFHYETFTWTCVYAQICLNVERVCMNVCKYAKTHKCRTLQILTLKFRGLELEWMVVYWNRFGDFKSISIQILNFWFSKPPDKPPGECSKSGRLMIVKQIRIAN